MSEWLTEREYSLWYAGWVGFVWDWVCPSPSSTNQRAPHNKVDEVACGQVCCETQSLYLLPLPEYHTKESFNRSQFLLNALTPNVCNPNPGLQECQDTGCSNYRNKSPLLRHNETQLENKASDFQREMSFSLNAKLKKSKFKFSSLWVGK